MWIIYAIAAVPQLVLILRSHPYSGGEVDMTNYIRWSESISIATRLSFGTLLIVVASRAALFVFPTEQVLSLNLKASSFQAILFSGIGLYLFAGGLAGAITAGIDLLGKPPGNTEPRLEYLWEQKKDALIAASAELAVGAVLFFGAHGLQRLWQRYRAGGAGDPTSPTIAETPNEE